MVVARAVVRDLCDPMTSAKVFSQLMLVMGLAPILAPVAGGGTADLAGRQNQVMDTIRASVAAQSEALSSAAAEILAQATSGNATLLNRTGELGTVARGAAADLIVVDGDPIRDISVLTGQGERIPLVMLAGAIRRSRLH